MSGDECVCGKRRQKTWQMKMVISEKSCPMEHARSDEDCEAETFAKKETSDSSHVQCAGYFFSLNCSCNY
jgi:hypothetical protein